MSIVVRRAARAEIADLLTDIASVNPTAAADVEANIGRTFAALEAQPLAGERLRVRNPNVRGLRVRPVRKYRQFVVLYLPTADGIDVLHVVRGRRNLGRVVAHD